MGAVPTLQGGKTSCLSSNAKRERSACRGGKVGGETSVTGRRYGDTRAYDTGGAREEN